VQRVGRFGPTSHLPAVPDPRHRGGTEAQNGGAGLIVYNRKEGRALGEVTKFLVYNARKRQPGGDQAATYFERTECVAGVQDARFQQLMPDVIHWLGIRRIDRFVSMSNMKYDALAAGGVEIGERVPIPAELVPPDASVEMEAKKAAGYYTPEGAPTADQLRGTIGRIRRSEQHGRFQ
jgi:GTP cyclohydrolase II